MRSDTYSGRINDVRKSLAGGKGGKDSCRCCCGGRCCVARGADRKSKEESKVCARLGSDFLLDICEQQGENMIGEEGKVRLRQ